MEENKKGLTSLEKKWVLYDVANSAFILMVSTLIQIFFHDIAVAAGVSEPNTVAYWNYAGTACTIAVVFLGPVFGTLADRRRMKKQLFVFTVVAGALCTLLLGVSTNWIFFIIIFAIAKVWYQVSLVVYDSMLNDVTTDERADTVSSHGYAFGYIGSVIPFICSLILYILASFGKIGISDTVAMQISFVITAIWWFVFSIPLIKEYKQIRFEAEGTGESNGFKEFFHSIAELGRTNKKALFFVIGFFFYIDGVYTIIENASIYAKSLGLASTGLLLALLVTQFVAFPCAIITGKMAKKWGSEIIISVCILGYTAIAILAFFMSNQIHFWILCVMVGLFQGGIQALSRSYFAKIIPKEKSGQYFSIFDIFGKGASALGAFIFGFITNVTGNQHIGILPIVFFFVIGFAFFRKSWKTESVVSKEESAA